LREPATCRNADEVRGGDAVVVQHRNRVREQIAPGIAGMSGLVGRRSAGVALVVADDEPAVPGEQPAELLRPPQHRAAKACHQEDRRIGRVAERLRAEPDFVHADQPLGD
jgi:hypothetical protein